MDLETILRAIAMVGESSDAGARLFEGFIPLLDGDEQAALKQRYAAARGNQTHTRVHGEFDQ